MIDLAIDPVGRDLVFIPGSFVPLDGAQRVSQAIGIRLRCWLGEWFLDTSHGVPYLDEVLGKGRRPEIIEAVLRAQILDVAGVLSIEEFTLAIDAQSRTARVDFSATSAEGLVRGSLALG